MFKVFINFLPILVVALIIGVAVNSPQGRQIIGSFAATNANVPIGYQDSPNSSNGTLYGWACDGDKFSQALPVHIYEGTTFIGATTASDGNEQAVTAACGNTPNHRWHFNLPASYLDGRAHSYSAYGINIDSSGVANGGNPLLTGSPKTITYASDKMPIGYQDAPNSSACVLYGWACDSDKYSQALNVDIYDGGKWVTLATANKPGEVGVASACGGFSAHRWTVDLSNAYSNPSTNPYRDGKPHTFTAKARSIYKDGREIGGIGTGNTFVLTGSPKTVTCTTIPTPIPSSTPTPVPSPTPTLAPSATPSPTPVQLSCSSVTVTGATDGGVYYGKHLYYLTSGTTATLKANTNPTNTSVNWKIATFSNLLPNGGSFSQNNANSTVYTAPINTSGSDQGVDVRGDLSEYPNSTISCPTITLAVHTK